MSINISNKTNYFDIYLFFFVFQTLLKTIGNLYFTFDPSKHQLYSLSYQKSFRNKKSKHFYCSKNQQNYTTLKKNRSFKNLKEVCLPMIYYHQMTLL